MTPRQLQAGLDKLGLTQVAFARLIGAGDRSVRGWVAGSRAVPETVAILLRLLLAGTLTEQDVERARK